MKFAFPLALSLAFGAVVLPAHAQMDTGGGMGGGMGGAGGAPKVQPKEAPPDLAPAGLPGIGAMAPLATGPKMQKAASGDPTQALFKAINDNNYNEAQDAVSRGADLRAKDQFGETPLDLAIALNRDNITFMLLGTRNELAAQDGGDVMGAPLALGNASSARSSKTIRSGHTSPLTPVRAMPKAPVLVNDPGTPDLKAGFLGFGAGG